jgi:hypothetical protein
MVNFTIVSEYDSSPPISGESMKIASGPLYELSRIKELAQRERGVFLWTRKCRHDTEVLAFDLDDVSALILELQEWGYRNSEWCENGNGGLAACDAYALSRMEWNEAAHKKMTANYFLKLAIGAAGAVILVVSCHLSN